MRSVKLLVAMAAVAALVAGPVLAQDAMSGSAAPAATSTDTAKPVKHHAKKHTGKKHKKAATSTDTTAAPAQ